MTGLLLLASSLCGMGCANMNFTGISVEGVWGTTSMEADPHDPKSRGGRADHVGINFALELDVGRASGMGMGMGSKTVAFPAADGAEAHEISGAATHFWISSLIDAVEIDWLRPRATVGVEYAGEDDSSFVQAYGGIGASLHPWRGLGLHFNVGPQYTSAKDRLVHGSGLGAQVRVRLVQMFFPSCDTPWNLFQDADGRIADDLCD